MAMIRHQERAVPEQPDFNSLIRRTSPVLVPADFDPLTASDDELAEFWIIPRPDRELQPELYQHWLRLFAPPITFVDPQIQEIRAAFQLNTSLARQPTIAAAVSRFATSRNWSGAFVVPTDSTMFVSVSGLWIVPAVSLPPPEFRVAGAQRYVCSTWVGLDGQRLYLNSSLPQIGTMQFLTVSGPPSPPALAFFQWWDRQNGGTFIWLSGLPVQPGDVLLGTIWAHSYTIAVGYLRNFSTGHMAIVRCQAPFIPVGGGNMQLRISGATAEWILERPTQFGSTTLYPFPDYQAMTFAGCWAGVAHAPGPLQSVHELATARLIRLYDTLHDPTRTQFISMPDKQSDTAVLLEYGDF